MPGLILSFLLFLLPLIIFPFGISFFETPKIFLAEFTIEVLIIYWILKFKKFDFAGIDRLLLTVLITLFLITLLQLLLLPNLRNNFFGNVFRLQGIFLVWHLLFFSIVSTNIRLRFTYSLALFTSVMLIFGAVVFGTNIAGRAISTLGEPNAFAASIVFLWPFLLFRKIPSSFAARSQNGTRTFASRYLVSLLRDSSFYNRLKYTRILGFILASIAIFLSGSRSGLIAFIIQSLFLLLNGFTTLSLKKSTVICLAFILLSLYLPFIEKGGLYENRLEIWQTALYAGLKNPLLGGGFGNIENLMKEAGVKLGNNTQYQYIDSSHNFLLDVWIEGGFVGLILFGLLITYSIKNMLNKIQLLQLTVLIGLLTVMLFNPISIVTWVQFWWVLGQGYFKVAEQ